MPKYAFVATFGCQMNEHDSEYMSAALCNMGYGLTQDLAEADLVLVNTCSIRQKAEEKAYSLLGRLKKYKEIRPHLMTIVASCLAQQEGKKLFHRVPHLNLVIGTRGVYRLPELLVRAENTARKIAYTALSDGYECYSPSLPGCRKIKSYVNIMTGCNNFCSYCIVPYVRGREISRKSSDVLKEIECLVEQGVKEITLLGQNVNSYGKGLDKECSFAELVRRIDSIEGMERLRFTTSHPKDLSDELSGCFGELKSLCPHIHLPVQSGSDKILKMMNRKYTRDDYLERVSKLRRVSPGITLTTDIIVGFPGESENDFEDTLKTMEEVRFAGAFAFKYSDRPPAKAASFKEKLPDEIKRERLSAVLALQEKLTYNLHESMVGKTVEVLIEGYSKNSRREWMGRTRTGEVVNITGGTDALGKTLRVRIEKACPHSLKGTLC
ncbi:MAG: tRNA (N6-isopentenyl adenosine(37)-C2)-methylthiotransferase MiaB [Pseudomonadota bacterium]